MRVEITTRHCSIDDLLKERVESRLGKMLRFDDRISDARVVINLEKNRFNVEATVQANGAHLVSHAVDENEKAALEQVLDRLEVQVRKHRDRVVKARKRAAGMGEAGAVPGTAVQVQEETEEFADAFGEDSDYEGLISEDAGDLAVAMSLAEAVAQLKVSRREVLGFTNRETQRPTLVFKRRDGNVGVVDMQRK